MSPRPQAPPTPFVLKAPTSGAGVLDPRSSLVLWMTGSILTGLMVSYYLARGEIRPIVLLLLGLVGLICLAPRRGVYILLIFLPFMYGVRRFVLVFQAFSARDPILLFPVLTASAMFLGVLIFYGPRLFRYLRQSPLLKACVLLMGVFVLQIFNPLQGGLFVGIAGGMYFIIPILWCFFGLMLRHEDMPRVLRIVLIIGLVTALYGLKQHYFGLTETEVYELKSKQFYKTLGTKDSVRVMSTFSSLGDFSLYLMVAAYLAFAGFWKKKGSLVLLMVVAISLFTMLWLAVRTSIILFLFSSVMLVVLYGRNRRQILVRGAVCLALVGVLYGILYTYEPEKMYDRSFSSNPYVVHTLSGITHPTNEKTLWFRLYNWGYIMSTAVYPNTFGRGLGSTTTAAQKFSAGGQLYEADSYFFEMFYGSGVVAPVLFVIIIVSTLKTLLRLCLDFPDRFVYRVVLGLLCGLALGSVFGMAARDIIVGPLMWLAIGWTVREEIDNREAAGAAA